MDKTEGNDRPGRGTEAPHDRAMGSPLVRLIIGGGASLAPRSGRP